MFSKLPNRWAQILGAGIGRLLFWINNREKEIASINLSLCFPELAEEQREELLKACLIENTKTLCEAPRIFDKGGQFAIDLVKEVEGLALFESALAEKKGVIVLAPHLGNWELVVHYLNQYSPMTAMFAPPKQAFLNDVMRRARQSSGATLVPADATGVRAQLKHLKKGGLIGILPDQQPKVGHAGIFAPFMGQIAYTMLLVNSLAQRTGAIPLMVFAERLSSGKGYKLRIQSAPEGIADKDTLIAATALNQGVADCVRLAPAQYQWTYKRFKHQPEGEKSLYDS